MLDQNFAMGDSYQDCDTTTPQSCLSTPFSVKDILNLNQDYGFPQGGHQVNKGYEDYFQQQYWEGAGYEQYNCGYYGGVDVKTEYPCLGFGKDYGCEGVYGIPHMQPFGSFCSLQNVHDSAKEIYSKTESPSKYYFLYNHFFIFYS